MNLQTNPELEMASDFVRNTNKHVFLTGKAGSGKTTFLHQLKADRLKRMAVVAPTGVAAINAGGMTIHSLFQISLGLHLPGVDRKLATPQPRFRQEKIRLIQSLDLLVIDEISMVRADLLDAVDEALQRIRNRQQPFGGVQLLMIGDLHQLPPVVKDEDWELLKQYYHTPYFFGSLALQKTDYISIELKHIYRQSDPEFISLLNRVRDNQIDTATLQKLNRRYVANYRPPVDKPSITLTATNAAAHQINQQNLNRLPGDRQPFKATITGDFPPSSYPTEKTLEFKVGAQVMFIRNDTGGRYFNGKLGMITRLQDGEIWVRCAEESSDIQVLPMDWKNVMYSLNEETKQIEEQVKGQFVQFPLKLAWAITIHKSQGLTFERCVIDAQTAFATGQVYVALSRCKTFEGIVLQTPIPASSIKTDRVVQEFSQEAELNYPTPALLEEAKRVYQVDAIRALFDFGDVARQVRQFARFAREHSNTILPETIVQLNGWEARVNTELVQISEKFAPQLAQYLRSEVLPESNEELQNRMPKAAVYFLEKLQSLLQEANNGSLMSDNKEVADTMQKSLERWRSSLFVKQSCFATCQSRFSAEELQRAVVNAELDFQKLAPPPGLKSIRVPKGLPNPELYKQLWQWRQDLAQNRGKPEYEIVPNSTIREMSIYLPKDKTEMLKMPGIGKGRFEQHGAELLAIIQTYRKQNSVGAAALSVADRPPRGVSETKRLSYEMWKAGDPVDQVAAKRGLSVSTVVGHLAEFVERGDIEIGKLAAAERVSEVLAYLQANPTSSSADAKVHFGGKYDYPELRLIFAHYRRLATRFTERDNDATSHGVS